MNNIQENIMLIAHKVTSKTDYLGNRTYMTTPWVMSEDKSQNFLDGMISLHNSKEGESYISGRITDVINLGTIDGRHRVAFVFKRLNKTVNPSRVRIKFEDTVSETREQVRY